MILTKRNCLGIFGGSFDPPHEGHVEISKIALKKIKFKKIFWIITKKILLKKNLFFQLIKELLNQKVRLKV